VNLAVIIGYGNSLRQDDGLGLRAAELLEERLAPGSAHVIRCHQLTPELAAELADAPLVLFLDAAIDETPGSVVCREILPHSAMPVSHHLSPEHLLALAHTLNGDAPPAWWITGGISQTDIGALTPAAERCAARMAEAALRLCYSTIKR
jgi:hydrogenase maturation protease